MDHRQEGTAQREYNGIKVFGYLCGAGAGRNNVRFADLGRLEPVEGRLPEVMRSETVWEMMAWCLSVGSYTPNKMVDQELFLENRKRQTVT